MSDRRRALRVREWCAAAITGGLDDRWEEAAVIKAMVLGEREAGAEEIEEAFLHSGTLHIFSVSGLHVGFVALIAWRGLNVMRFGRRVAAWVSIPLVILYALVTGWQPAAARSALMAVVVLGGIGLNRPPAFFNSLCLAALVLLAGDTHQMFMPGAQLSFVVIGVIAAGAHPVARWLDRWVHPDEFLPRRLWSRGWCVGRGAWGWLARMMAVSLVAGAGSAPLTWWHFQLATPVSLAANLVHVPLAGLILATAGLSVAGHFLSISVASIFTNANAVFARLGLVTAGWFAEVPGGSVGWNPRALVDPAPACRITVFDVEAGGAVLVRTPRGRAWLLDTGRPAAFRRIVRPGIAYRGLRRIDGLILSHGDHEHVGGAVEVLERYAPSFLGHAPHPSRSPAMRAALAQGAAVARPLVAGDSMALDDLTTLRVLWPPRQASLPVADDGCLVVRLECAGRSVVFTNDAGFLAEQAMRRAGLIRRTDVWVRGHHATDLSGTEDFVRALRPTMVVVARSWRRQATAPAFTGVAPVATGARVYDQVDSGAVEMRIGLDGSLTVQPFLRNEGD